MTLQTKRFELASSVRCVIWLCLITCVLLSGCNVCRNAKRTLLGEPAEYWWLADRKRSVKVYRAWADQAWCKHGARSCSKKVSSAYEKGFKDGFVDYVFAGGTGEPPPVPPRPFWNVGQRKLGGQMQATEWFAGFRHGAEVARNEGYREQTIVPVSVLMGSAAENWQDQNVVMPPFVETIQPVPSATGEEVGPLESWDDSAAPELVMPVPAASRVDMPPAEEFSAPGDGLPAAGTDSPVASPQLLDPTPPTATPTPAAEPAPTLETGAVMGKPEPAHASLTAERSQPQANPSKTRNANVAQAQANVSARSGSHSTPSATATRPPAGPSKTRDTHVVQAQANVSAASGSCSTPRTAATQPPHSNRRQPADDHDQPVDVTNHPHGGRPAQAQATAGSSPQSSRRKSDEYAAALFHGYGAHAKLSRTKQRWQFRSDTEAEKMFQQSPK